MSIYSLFNDPFDPFPLFGGRSVYVISDSEMAKYKRAQLEREIQQLEELKEGHLKSISCLETNIEKLRADLPELPATKEETPEAA